MAIRYTILHMQQIAKEKGGKCQSQEYRNDETVLKWMCTKGHTWDATYTYIRNGGWCMQCAKNESGMEKLDELKQIAKRKEGKCLSEFYINNHTKLKWECKEKHIWEADVRSIKERDL